MSDGAAQKTEEFSIEEWNNQIRREKFDLILPQAMRPNNIDMGIVISRGKIHFCLVLKLKLIKGGAIMVVRRDIPRTMV